MMRFVAHIILFIGLLLHNACTEPSSINKFIGSLNGEINISEIHKHKYNALVFLSPECPLSEASLMELNRLQRLFENQNYSTKIIIPGNLFSKQEITLFKNRLNISFPILIDSSYYLTNYLKASITPEYFLVDENMIVLYSGAIDDRALDNDIIRQEATTKYAENAMLQLLKGNKIEYSKTKAVGCYIER